jgi:putative transposase
LIERIKSGNPQQNGRHERMHLTLRKEATKTAAANFLQQQDEFDDFIAYYNHDRPHQALGMQYDLGYFDHETCRLESIDNPFQAKVLPMCLEWTRRLADLEFCQ